MIQVAGENALCHSERSVESITSRIFHSVLNDSGDKERFCPPLGRYSFSESGPFSPNLKPRIFTKMRGNIVSLSMQKQYNEHADQKFL